MSLNNYVDKQEKLRFSSVSEVTKSVRPGWWLAKLDLAEADRSVRIHLDCFQVAGIAWKFASDEAVTYLVDTRLPFGATASVNIFHRLTQAVSASLLQAAD
jgi:hypothetical protein